MTEKQFTIADVYDMSVNEVADLLNEQGEKIQSQRKEIKSWIKYVHELEAELKKYR